MITKQSIWGSQEPNTTYFDQQKEEGNNLERYQEDKIDKIKNT